MLFKMSLVIVITFTTSLCADVLSIYDIQYTADPLGDSPLAGSIVDCAGGVVLDKFIGGKTKLTIYDENNPDGWGGIFAVTIGAEFADIEPGDVVSFSSVLVEEYRGNTQLVFGGDSAFSIIDTAAALPGPLVVNPADIAYPPDAVHAAEKYEAMFLQVQNVTVTEMDLGKASDNYALQDATGTCWATDYYISDETGSTYHPYVHIGANLDSVAGILEQYVRNEWDYYQICTNDFSSVVPEPGSIMLFLLGGGMAFRRRPRG